MLPAVSTAKKVDNAFYLTTPFCCMLPCILCREIM